MPVLGGGGRQGRRRGGIQFGDGVGGGGGVVRVVALELWSFQ